MTHHPFQVKVVVTVATLIIVVALFFFPVLSTVIITTIGGHIYPIVALCPKSYKKIIADEIMFQRFTKVPYRVVRTPHD